MLQQQAAAAAAARARAEEEQKAVRPQRKPAARPVRTRAASPSSDSEEVELESPYARYRGMLPWPWSMLLIHSVLEIACLFGSLDL